MRILLALSGHGNCYDRQTCQGIRHVQAYNLATEFLKHGHEVVYCRVGSGKLDLEESRAFYRSLDVPDADHCLCLEPRGFHRRTFGQQVKIIERPHPVWRTIGECPFLDAVRRKVRGCVSTVCDMPRALAGEDVTFYGLRYPEDYPLADRTVRIGWAADGKYLFPDQPNDGKVHMLLDHGHYNKKADDSDMLLRTLEPYAAKVAVRRFSPYGVEDVPMPGWTPVVQEPPTATHAQAAAAHRWAHIFCVTHQESLGLSVLEAAMAGNLVVLRDGFIKRPLVEPLYHVAYQDEPLWHGILQMADPAHARRLAEPFDRWSDMADIMLYTFEGF